MKTIPLPLSIQKMLTAFRERGFEAFAVGGCVRDAILGRSPKDWDIATNAAPSEIQKIFSDTLYNNRFGTVIVRFGGQEIEATPYRKEQHYSDARHPDVIEFGATLKEDLSRRDFTMNAIATDGNELRDPFHGQKDIEKKVIRAVGGPNERFSEDALRMLRAIRLAAELRFSIERKTKDAIKRDAHSIAAISAERIRDEFMKIVMADDSTSGLLLLAETGLLRVFLPELAEGLRESQNKHHIYSVFFHSVLSLQYCPSNDPMVRLAALFHDIGKPATKEGKGPDATFYKHDIVGAEIAEKVMRRLRFSNDDISKAVHLVRHHLFFYNVGEVSDSGVRRLIRRIGKENIRDFFVIRIADRMGSGCQIEMPFKLQQLEKHMKEVQKDPIDTRMLEIDGHDIMRLLTVKPGPKVGEILNALLEEILDDPKKNTREYLEQRALELWKKPKY